jgi:hypothetical protein
VAAATTAIAGGVSAGVAVAAGPPAGPVAAARLHPAGAAADAHAGSTAASQAPAHASPQATAAGQPAAATSARPTVGTSPQPAASTRASAASAAAGRPYLIYDSLLPAALPTGHVVATYATGPGAVAPSQLAGRGPVLWIDVNATDPAADVLDVEPGNATPAAASGWVYRRLTANPKAVAILYSSISEWPALQAAVASLPAGMRAQIRWWIADPTGYAHLVPGSDATQWYWGHSYDISTALPRF